MEVNLCNSSYSSQSFTPILKCDFLSDFLQTCVNLILWNTQVPPPQSAASGNAELAPLGFAQLRARIFHFAPRWARGGRKLSVHHHPLNTQAQQSQQSFVYLPQQYTNVVHYYCTTTPLSKRARHIHCSIAENRLL